MKMVKRKNKNGDKIYEENIAGQIFGDFKVKKVAKVEKSVIWLCQCINCSGRKLFTAENLKRSNEAQNGKKCQYCKILQNQCHFHQNNGYTTQYPKLYKSYRMMKYRCQKPTDPSYKWYGARGIKVCEEWSNSFTAYCDYVMSLEHFGESGRSLDRIDNNGDYCPGNVRWATAKEQNANKRPRGKNLKKYCRHDKLKKRG